MNTIDLAESRLLLDSLGKPGWSIKQPDKLGGAIAIIDDSGEPAGFVEPPNRAATKFTVCIHTAQGGIIATHDTFADVVKSAAQLAESWS